MSSYELWIEKDGEWNMLDLNEVPVMNYQSNNINEIKNRGIDFSMAINLPKTRRNLEIFNFANLLYIVSDFPYRQHRCRLTQGGLDIAGRSAYLRILEVNENLVCQVRGGSFDILTALRDAPMSAIPMGSIPRENKYLDPDKWGDNWCYALSTFVKEGDHRFTPDVHYIYPFVKLESIVNNMILSHGFKLNHNLSGRWDNKYLPIVDLKPDEDSFNSLKSVAIYKDNSTTVYLGYEIIDNPSDNMSIYYSEGSPRLQYNMKYSGNGNLRIKASSEVLSEGSHLEIKVMNKTQDWLVYETIEGDNFDKTVYFDFSDGDDISISTIVIGSNGAPVKNGLKILDIIYTINIDFMDKVPYGGRIPISRNIGFDNQYNFFETFVQTFGLFVTVDNDSKVVNCYTTDKLYDNKPKAIDWSNKFSIDPANDIQFTQSNYGRKSIIKFNDNSDDNITDSGFFTVDDELLNKEKELFTIGFDAGLDKEITYQSNIGTKNTIVANIPSQTLTIEDGNRVYSFDGTSAHIIELSDDRVQVLVQNEIYYYPIATHPKVQYFIDTFYRRLYSDLLHRSKLVTCPFLLNNLDISKFDQFTPVYIDQLGSYFFVNKIQNYGAYNLTTCELFRM